MQNTEEEVEQEGKSAEPALKEKVGDAKRFKSEVTPSLKSEEKRKKQRTF